MVADDNYLLFIFDRALQQATHSETFGDGFRVVFRAIGPKQQYSPMFGCLDGQTDWQVVGRHPARVSDPLSDNAAIIQLTSIEFCRVTGGHRRPRAESQITLGVRIRFSSITLGADDQSSHRLGRTVSFHELIM